MGLSLLKPPWVSVESFSRVWKAIIGAGGNPTVPQREDKCGVGIQGDSTERLLATWRFPAWKKVETEMSWL